MRGAAVAAIVAVLASPAFAAWSPRSRVLVLSACFEPGTFLLGCEACGAPLVVRGMGGDPTSFLDPSFFETHIPFIAFRGVSDGRGDPLMLPPVPYLQFTVYQQLAADNAAAVALAFLAAW